MLAFLINADLPFLCDSRDLHALVRVEALERGDNCTVSWKLIPEPVAKPVASQSRQKRWQHPFGPGELLEMIKP